MIKSSYDKIYDILYLQVADSPWKKCLDFGDVILDVDKEGHIIGIEVLNAKCMFSCTQQDEEEITDLLSHLEHYHMQTKTSNGFLVIKLFLYNGKENLRQIISLPMSKILSI